jgi:hypothetical protein
LAQVFVDMGTCLGSAELSRTGHGHIQGLLTDLLAELSEPAELKDPENQTPRATGYLPVCRYIQLANPHFVILLRPEHKPSPGTLRDQSPHPSKAILDRLESWLTRHGDALKRALHDCDHGGPQSPETGTLSKNAERAFDRAKVGDVNLGLLWNDGGQPDSPHVLVVHERGAGVTAACGSGCVAAAFALRLHRHEHPAPTKTNGTQAGVFASSESFRMPGGMLSVSLAPKSPEPSGTFNTAHDTAPFTAGPLEDAPTLWATMGGEAVYVGFVAWDAHECSQA